MCAADIFFSFTHFAPQRQSVLRINEKDPESISFAGELHMYMSQSVKAKGVKKNLYGLKAQGAVVTLQERSFERILCIAADLKKHF